MSPELKILKLFTENRDSYMKYRGYITAIHNLDREIKLIIGLIHRYYEQYPEHSYIGKEELMTFYDFCYPNSRDKEIHHEQIGMVYEADVSTSVLIDLIEQMIERHHANEILNMLIPVIDGNKYGVLHRVTTEIEKFNAVLKNPPMEVKGLEPCNLTLEELVKQEIADPGIPWQLPKLNDIIGGLRRKTLGCIFAFVDSGKTSFGLSACASFAHNLRDTAETIVYAGNEESSPRLSLRLSQAMLHRTRREIETNFMEFETQRREHGYMRVKVLDSISTGTDLLRILDEWQPRVLFIDQGTKVTIDRGKTKEIEALQTLFNFYREKAKEYDTSIICLAQGVGEAENRKWLKLSDIYGSRVAIQGELDYAIGIGRTLDDQYTENFRYINIPKNKLKDGETGRFQTVFTKEQCKWEEIA